MTHSSHAQSSVLSCVAVVLSKNSDDGILCAGVMVPQQVQKLRSYQGHCQVNKEKGSRVEKSFEFGLRVSNLGQEDWSLA